ncbi:MAG TPA: universal stress protein [Acidimicrobiales bacterium]|nr:universal stress protein [Acidimicrobiales bacterium]
MTALQTIAVGFDGSADSTVAARWAFDLARRVGADVVLVHAVGLLGHLDRGTGALDLATLGQRLIEESSFNPERVRWHVADGDACSVLTRVMGDPVGADLLVVGTRGRGAHAGILIGSTSLELAQHATFPLVIIPREDPPPA